MHILIFDTNTVFARRVGEAIEKVAPNVRISYAQNCPILRLRLDKHKYDLILADPSTAFDIGEASRLLHDAQELHKTPVIVWSFLSKESVTSLNSFDKVIAKPNGPCQVEDLHLADLVTA